MGRKKKKKKVTVVGLWDFQRKEKLMGWAILNVVNIIGLPLINVGLGSTLLSLIGE